jgi:hypothetical protein
MSQRRVTTAEVSTLLVDDDRLTAQDSRRSAGLAHGCSIDAVLCIKQPKDPVMSILRDNDISYLPDRASTRPLAADWAARCSVAHSGGYAFETALCLVESQSPQLRPLSARPARAATPAAVGQTRELSSRILLLSNLFNGVLGQFDLNERLVLLTTANRVTTELIAAFGLGADRPSTDSSVDAFDRRAAADARGRAAILLERIRSDLAGLRTTSAAA